MSLPEYHFTRLMEMICQRNTVEFDPHTVAIMNDGNGPCMCYRNCYSHIKEFYLRLNYDGRVHELSHTSEPPYLVALSQDNKDSPAHLILYREGLEPELEYGGIGRLAGIVLAYSWSPHENNQTLVSALYSPVANHLFTSIKSDFSMVAERNPELCKHLLLFGDALLWLMKQELGGESL